MIMSENGACVQPGSAVSAVLPAEECYVLLPGLGLILGADQGSWEEVVLQNKHQPA